MSTVVSVTDRGFDSSISRGNLRSNSFYNSADHLHTGGNLRGIPMPMRRSLTVLNSPRDLTMGRGQVIDNIGQRSPRASPSGIDNDCMDKGQVIDNTGQRSPRGTPYDIDDGYMARDQVIDNAGQRSSHTKSTSRIPEIGVASNSINFSQSVTQILATLGKDGHINPREGLAVISAYTDTWKDTMIARFNDQEERLLGLENQAINSRNTIARYENSFMGFHKEVIKLNEIIKHHEKTVHSWVK